MEYLRSKLEPPRRQNIFCRGRLNRFFANIHRKNLATVIAGAGYGKTTLVSDALSGINPVWYRLDDQDMDFQVFVSYLYACFGKTRDAATALNQPEQVLIKWLAFVEKTISNHTVLVLDDFHLVQESRPVIAALEFILERLPSLLHLVIIGRRELPIHLSLMRARGQVIEIDETGLSFTGPEIKSFFEDSNDIAASHLDDIYSNTGGWAAGLVLLRYAMKNRGPEALVDGLKGMNPASQYMFAYLKENIFDPLPGDVKTFMMKAALLPEIDARLCSRIFDEKNAHKILKQMASDHLMIFPVDDTGTVFTLHHLMQEFLVSRLKAHFLQDDIYRLHLKIAKAVEPGDIFQALNHYIEGQSFDDAIRLIETHEMTFLIHGKINFLNQCLWKIPEQVIEKNPKLLLAQAKMLSHFGGDHRKTRDLIIRAHLLFKKLNAKDDMVSSLVELGSHYYYTGHVKEAKLLMEQVLEDVDPASVTYVIAMTYLTFLSAVLGEFDTADAYHCTAMEVIGQYPEYEQQASTALINTSLTHTLYFKGDFEASLRLSKKLLKIVISLNIDPCLPLVYYQLSADCHALGHFKAGCDYAEKGIAACEKMDLADSRKAWVYLAWAQNCVGLGHMEKAEDLLEKSTALFEEPGNRWGMANAWECLHHVYLARGKEGKAVKVLNSALDIIDGYGLIVTRGLLTNSLVALLIRQKEYDRAEGMLSQIRPRLKQSRFHLFTNHLLTAKTGFDSGRTKAAFKHLCLALGLAEELGFERFLLKEKAWLLPVLQKRQAGRTDRSFNFLKQLFEEDLAIVPPVLRLSLFGPFEMTINNETVPASRFKSANALLALKYLAANRSRGFIHKEELIELLWPNENPLKTGARFNMAMSALRKILEPDLPPKAVSSYIERKKNLYRLYTDERIRIDTELFSDAILRAKKMPANSLEQLEALMAAERLYRGDFLEEDRYEEFCIEKRHTFTLDYQKVLRTIITACETHHDPEKTLFYTARLVKADPVDDASVLKLMTLYSRAGNIPGVKKTFSAYQTAARQMDLPVSDEIKTIYRRLV